MAWLTVAATASRWQRGHDAAALLPDGLGAPNNKARPCFVACVPTEATTPSTCLPTQALKHPCPCSCALRAAILPHHPAQPSAL
jgi:hypothetical protein